MGKPISSRRIDSTKPGTTGSFHHEPAPIPTPSFISAHPPRSADESYIGKLHRKVTYESYMQKLQAKVTCESYKCINIQESCIIIQSGTDPEGSAKVTRKVV